MFTHCKHTDGVKDVAPTDVTKQQAAGGYKEVIELRAGHAFRFQEAIEKMGPA